MRKHFTTEIDLEFEYKDTWLKFQMVAVTGTVLRTYPQSWYEPSECVLDFSIDMTAQNIQDWVVEGFEDNNRSVPPWAYTDGQTIQDVMRDRIEMLIDAG